MKGYQALQIAVEEGKKIQLNGKWYEYRRVALYNQDNELCAIPFDELMADGWSVKEEVLV